jgi:hypothetical protein
VVTTLLAEWPLTGDFFDGDHLNGPVPRLFTPDPDAARAAISSDPSKAFKDLQRIHARIPISEHVTPEEAWEYVGNPRYLNKQYRKISQHLFFPKIFYTTQNTVLFTGHGPSFFRTSARPTTAHRPTPFPHPRTTRLRKTSATSLLRSGSV